MAIFRKQQDDVPARRRQDTSVRQPATPDASYGAFARNRTLTGTTSDAVTSTTPYNDTLRSPRTHVHHLARQRRKLGMILLIIISASAVLLWLLLQFSARVTISLSDTTISREIDTARYEKAVDDYFGQHPLSRLRVALDAKQLGDYLASVVPEVEQVTAISLGGIGETNITVVMRKPVAGWTIEGKQYFVDANGVAFEKNYYSTPSVQIVDNSGVGFIQGTAVASNRFLGFVGRIVALSHERGYTVTQAIIPSGTTRQLEVQLQEVGTHVRFSIDRPAGEQVEDMARSLQYLAKVGRAPGYIDVRVSGKAFYK